MAALAGVIFCLAAFVGIIFVVVRALIFGDPTAGWPSMVCIMLLCSGVQLFCLGIVGEYLAKTYLEVKHRPIYITRETEQDRDERKPAQQKLSLIHIFMQTLTWAACGCSGTSMRRCSPVCAA